MTELVFLLWEHRPDPVNIIETLKYKFLVSVLIKRNARISWIQCGVHSGVIGVSLLSRG